MHDGRKPFLCHGLSDIEKGWNKTAAFELHQATEHDDKCAIEDCSDELLAAAGLPAPVEPPALCHYSPGVDVEVFALRQQQ